MIYLNFTDLNQETQRRLIAVSKEDIKTNYAETLLGFAKKHNMNFDTLLEEEARRNLHAYTYFSNI